MEGNGFTTGIIEDGYTQSAYIEAIAGLYPTIRFRFRPVMVRENSIIVRKQAHCYSEQPPQAGKAQEIAAEVVASLIVSWDIKDSRGEDVPITKDMVLRLRPALFAHLFAVVMGETGADTPPSESTEGGSDDELAAAISGEHSETFTEKN